jgi:hypothetical protein
VGTFVDPTKLKAKKTNSQRIMDLNNKVYSEKYFPGNEKIPTKSHRSQSMHRMEDSYNYMLKNLRYYDKCKQYRNSHSLQNQALVDGKYFGFKRSLEHV